MDITVTHIDTACCLIDIAGVRILTDPVLDKAGGLYHHGYGAISRKTASPAVDEAALSEVDLVLLSHPQHKDNFDTSGRAFARSVPLVLSTPPIEKDYRNGQGLRPWESYDVALPDASATLTITATPARHHPRWLPRFFSGEVIGFHLAHSKSEDTLYISGDTVFFEGIHQVAQRWGAPTYALIHVGSAEFRYLTGPGKFTMGAKGFIDTVSVLNPTVAIPIHNGGWTHFKESDEGLQRELLAADEELRRKVHFLPPGRPRELKLLATENGQR